jgi:hypothetical protein
MTDAELEAIAVKCGIYWVSEKTAYVHADTMRAFADAIAATEKERLARVAEDFLTKGRSPLGRSVAAAIRGA